MCGIIAIVRRRSDRTSPADGRCLAETSALLNGRLRAG